MLIRLANSSDAAELKKLNDAFNGEECNTVELVKESLISNEQEIVYVAADGNKLVGFCCGQILKSMCYPSNYGEITELYVIDEYRRQGIGRQLLKATENELNKRGVNHLHILTGDKNTVAQALYKSNGYVKTSEVLFDKD